MQNKEVRKTIPEPLMFIHTVSTPIVTNGSRRYFDSRDRQKDANNSQTKIILPVQNLIKNSKKIDNLLLNKINNIIQMYKMDNPISCLIETYNNESIEGIPYKIENETLFIKYENTEIENIIPIILNDIKDVIILKV